MRMVVPGSVVKSPGPALMWLVPLTRSVPELVKGALIVLPGRDLVDVPMEHPVFHAFYDVTEILQVPNVYQGSMVATGGPTHEYDGYVPRVRGIFDDDGRLMVLVNWNSDMGDGWEHTYDQWYPTQYANAAYRLGINYLIYSLTH